MNTQELVSAIKEDYAPEYARLTILGYLDRAQNELFSRDCAQMTYLNESDVDFPIPILNTVADTLSYDIVAANLVDTTGTAHTPSVGGYNVTCRRIRRIFMQSSSLATTSYNRLFYGEQFDWAGINDFWSKRLYRVRFYEVPGYIYDKTGLDNARFVFSEDPGTEDSMYYVEFFYGPVELTSESIPLSLDGDKWAEALIDGVNGYIEKIENGLSQNLADFRKYWIPKFAASMNKGARHRRPLQMPMREYG